MNILGKITNSVKGIIEKLKSTIAIVLIVFQIGCLIGFTSYPIVPDKFQYITYDISHNIREILFQRKPGQQQWIGTRIEFISRGKVGLSNIESDIIQTDKLGSKNIILENQDQKLKNIGLPDKHNSLDFIVWLRIYKNKNEPVCLLTYGERKPRYSQLKNIIQINRFPSSVGIEYDKLSPSERDQSCYDNQYGQGITIVSPS